MIRIEKEMELPLPYDLSRIGDPEKILFFDIETTGLSAYASALYLIGAGFYKDGKFHFLQWFAESLSAESDVLRAFFEFCEGFDVLLHFNGDTFDLRYLTECAEQYRISCPLQKLRSYDILKQLRKKRSLYGLPNLKLKTVEMFLGIDREDLYTGGELIEVYGRFTESRDEELLKLLLLHNEEDITGLPGILPVLTYQDALNTELADCPEHFLNKSGSQMTVMTEFPFEFPARLEYELSDSARLFFEGNTLTAELDTYAGELYYFFPNPKDYYYLPKEDRAIHKKLASFVDKNHRVQAKAENCYTRTEGLFLPAVPGYDKPCFYHAFHEKKGYVQYREENLTEYLNCLLDSV